MVVILILAAGGVAGYFLVPKNKTQPVEMPDDVSKVLEISTLHASFLRTRLVSLLYHVSARVWVNCDSDVTLVLLTEQHKTH